MKLFVANILIGACLFCLSTATAQLSLPKILGNGMVLQSKQQVPVWGTAKPNDAVVVSFKNQSKKTIADASGNWKIMLDAMPPSATGANMLIASPNEKILLTGILIGEVWLCSGQSNMEYTMRKNSKVEVPGGETNWPVKELETAHNKSIRIFLVDRKKMSPDNAHAGWDIAEGEALRSFSAVGYFFAKKMYEELHVPVGIISAAIPGSRIEPWMPEEAFTALPFFREHTDSTHKIDGDPGKFYSSMIEPLVPFALKGFLWYQGESNCFLNERIQYTYKMEALINHWRKVWHDDRLPFYYVQIAPFEYSKSGGDKTYTKQSLPEFWEAQQLTLKIPYTAIIGTTDLNFNMENLHPHFKWEIGKRLAIAALANDYGKKKMIPMGPTFDKMEIHGNKVIVNFKYAGPQLLNNSGQPPTDFFIAGADGKYQEADAKIAEDKIELSSDKVANPKTVRYGWDEGFHPNLYNKQGLPAMPFRTDNPLINQFKVSGIKEK